MKKIITIIMLLAVIGAASAAWYPRSADYNTSGDVNAANGAFSGNISVTGILTAGSTVNNGVIDGDVRLAANHSFYSTTGSGAIDWSNGTGPWKMPTGAGTIAGTTDFNGAITCREVTLDNNYNLTMGGTGGLTSGTGAIDFNGAMSTKAITQDSGYSITQAGASGITVGTTGITAVSSPLKLLENVTIASGKSFAMSGAGTTTLGTGAISLPGDTTIASNKALAVTTADKLTVGGVIVPQEMAIPFTYTASSVDIGVFSAKGAWNITAVELVPRVAGNDANAVNVTVKVCDSGEAPASGDAALSAVLDLKGTADTTQIGTLGANVAVSATQYIALDFSGTLTNAAGMGTIWIKRV